MKDEAEQVGTPAARTPAPSSTPPPSTLPPIYFILIAALLWSTGGLFIKSVSLSAYELSFGRSLLAALTVAYFTRREGFRLNLVTAIAAVLYAALLLLFVVANKLTTAANAIFLQYTAPVYILLFEPLFYREKFRARDFYMVAVCVAGMSLFFVGELRPDDLSGNLTALASGLCFAFFTLLLRHPRTREGNRAASVIYGNLLLALVCAPAFFGGVGLKLTLSDGLSIFYLGVVQIGIAYTFFTLGIARGVRSLDAGVVGYVEPVLNPVWVFIFLGERPTRWAISGGAIIVAAVVTHLTLRARRDA
ncbi:MAG TPA: EamA family transporter [Pyrinomonadaceae bacterium]|jgi:drug/metabolite transporter (DMT)-like permease|nr:EamA family transporter [Pyrinomonadaceae bacterium]